jgi:ATP-dependent DNA helicase PIF1
MTSIPINMNLSPEQELALEKFKEGKNIFLTGPGGSGKTEIIRRMVTISKEQQKVLQVCALTGCAAILLECNARTVHSFAGIGLASGTIDEICYKVISSTFKSKNWTNVDILIIDEISMMSCKLFDILDTIGRRTRKISKPFGGIQLVFSGDFYQLPPVGTPGQLDTSAFCFESVNWKSTFDEIILLKTIFRQSDPIYTSILNQIRVGKLKSSSYKTLQEHINKPLPILSFKPTNLHPKRKEVDTINTSEFEKLTGESKTYTITQLTIPSKISYKKEQLDFEYMYLENNIMANKTIILKIGTQVMCIANIDMDSSEPLVNGSQGVVIDFINDLPIVQFNNGYRRTVGYHTWLSETMPIGIKQMPLIYAWAITIHKAQGVSLDMAQIDAGSNIFECGQTYVALSRVKSLDGLYLTDFNPSKIKVNKKVQDYYLLLN